MPPADKVIRDYKEARRPRKATLGNRMTKSGYRVSPAEGQSWFKLLKVEFCERGGEDEKETLVAAFALECDAEETARQLVAEACVERLTAKV